MSSDDKSRENKPRLVDTRLREVPGKNYALQMARRYGDTRTAEEMSRLATADRTGRGGKHRRGKHGRSRYRR